MEFNFLWLRWEARIQNASADKGHRVQDDKWHSRYSERSKESLAFDLSRGSR
jgi:hypothetical protein